MIGIKNIKEGDIICGIGNVVITDGMIMRGINGKEEGREGIC